MLGSISSPKTDRWKKKRTQNCVTKGKGKGKGKGRSSYVYDLKLSDSTDTSEDSGRVASFRHTDSTHTNTYTGENGSQRGRTQHEHKGSEGSPASPTSDNEEEDVHMSGQNDYGDGESHIQFKAREGVLGRPRRNSKKTKKVKELERQWAHQRR